MADKEQKPKAPKAEGGESKAKSKGKETATKGDSGRAAAQAGKVAAAPKGYIPRLKTLYRKQVAPDLIKRFQFANPMLAPRLEKIVLNVGVGQLHADQRYSESLQEELRLIAGQKPVLTRARKSISNFKLREGMVVGCRVTLRGDRMFEFLDRLISTAIPRIRDFRGLSDRSFDGRGNYTFGLKEQIIFHEIDYDKVVKIHGMDITISTTARTDEEALELLKGFGFPFRRRGEAA
ncbi:MAG: 50S ribosomal protein L5 [Calditrichaeota bacterium]|nr:50S ribosomal protein L5 [Calditrichota bacterium]